MTELANHRIAYFNGKYLPEREVLVRFRDRSFKLGDAAFDMTRTFNGRVFRLQEHVERLYRSLRYLRIDPGLAPGEMVAAAERGLCASSRLRLRAAISQASGMRLGAAVRRGGGWR
jgi:branched-chain amino acid aminotransferase